MNTELTAEEVQTFLSQMTAGANGELLLELVGGSSLSKKLARLGRDFTKFDVGNAKGLFVHSYPHTQQGTEPVTFSFMLDHFEGGQPFAQLRLEQEVSRTDQTKETYRMIGLFPPRFRKEVRKRPLDGMAGRLGNIRAIPLSDGAR